MMFIIFFFFRIRTFCKKNSLKEALKFFFRVVIHKSEDELNKILVGPLSRSRLQLVAGKQLYLELVLFYSVFKITPASTRCYNNTLSSTVPIEGNFENCPSSLTFSFRSYILIKIIIKQIINNYYNFN